MIEFFDDGLDEISLGDIREINLDHFSKVFSESTLPTTEAICLVYESKDDKKLKLIVDFLADHYKMVLAKKKKQKTMTVKFRKTLH